MRTVRRSSGGGVKAVMVVIGFIDPLRRSHIFAVMGRHDGDCRGCRNQRSGSRELMGYPRLSPVDETAVAFGSR
jgi:hypothetical protein